MKFSTVFVTAALTFALLFNGATAAGLRAINPSDSDEGETTAISELRFPGKIGDLKTMEKEMMKIKDTLVFSDSYLADPCNGVKCGGMCYYYRTGATDAALEFGMCDGAGECRPYNDMGKDEVEYRNFYVSDLMNTCEPTRRLDVVDDVIDGIDGVVGCGGDCALSCLAAIFGYAKCLAACTAKCALR